MVSKLFLAIRLALILFPTPTGVVLTGFGASKLNEAYIVSTEPWTAPFGFLIFSTMKTQENVEAHLWISDISLKDRTAQVTLVFFSFNSFIRR